MKIARIVLNGRCPLVTGASTLTNTLVTFPPKSRAILKAVKIMPCPRRKGEKHAVPQRLRADLAQSSR